MTGRWLVPTFLAVSIFFCEAGVCQPSAPPARPAATQFRDIHVDVSKVKGTIRSFQGVNGVPTPIMQGLPNVLQQYKALGIDVIRTHDTMGPTDVSARFSLNNPLLTWLVPDSAQRASLVQSGNDAAIFPNWEADPERPENYNFGPSDTVIQGIRATGAQVFYRIGRSWGAD